MKLFYFHQQLCVGDQRRQSDCGVDSSGPLTVADSSGSKFTQIGLLSFGIGLTNCGPSHHPEVFTSVSHYKNWIEENMNP